MSWEKSEIMQEFLKIAANENMLGFEKSALPEQNPYQEDTETIKDKTLDPPDKHVVEQAHPESVYVAESQGDGALVENQLEQQQKLIEMINKHPTGSIVGRYAHAISSMIKMAEAADEAGIPSISDALTDSARQLVQQMSETVDNMHSTTDYIDAELQSLLGEEDFPLEEAPTEKN